MSNTAATSVNKRATSSIFKEHYDIYCINDKKDLSLFKSLNNTTIMLMYAQMSKIRIKMIINNKLKTRDRRSESKAI